MAAEQRKMLERLMGAGALEGVGPRTKGKSSQSGRRQIDLYSSDICKPFLVKTCVKDLMAGADSSFRHCNKKHFESDRMEYEAQVKQGKRFPEFQAEYEREVERHIREVKQRIIAAKKKLDYQEEDLEKLSAASKRIETLNTMIKQSLAELEALGTAGLIERALQLQSEVEVWRKEREAKEKDIKVIAARSGYSGVHKLQACALCGAYMSRTDTDRRLADHLLGKTHLVHVELWDLYKELHPAKSAD